MTLEQLYDLDADALEKLTDTEVIALFAPMFNVTRPEQVERARQASKAPVYVPPAKQNAFNKLKEAGIDLAELGLTPKRKKR